MWRRRAAVLAVLIALVLMAAAAALYLRYRALPAGYVDPDSLPRAVLEGRARSFRTAVHLMTGHLLSREPFDVTFADADINAYVATLLAHTEGAWYEELRLPPEVEHVQVKFEPETVVVFGRLNRGWASCIFSVRARLAVDERGDLAVAVRGVHGGRLAVPRTLVGSLIRAWDGRPFTVRAPGGPRARLAAVTVGEGTIRLVGGPAAPDPPPP